ncbi:hypothetical protein KUTeg_022140 [Tegillarca granosa]|uniref:DDE Tnp4 domain-containing protein n=1 Tax=Tegillarca granosa TaxID=220873 RepID=A0ABQ9E5D0_TEGGR|nr:hypothetical protein KUTeg_022140 [Tegillarca granosa]
MIKESSRAKIDKSLFVLSGFVPFYCIVPLNLILSEIVPMKRCLHKTGGSLPYKPGKCTKIIECAMRLHNLAIGLKVPLTEDVEPQEVDDNQDLAPTFKNNMTVAALRGRIIQRF